MQRFRIIPKIDIKDTSVIKGVNFEGMRKVGIASELAKKYYLEGADEIVLNDVNASFFGRNTAIDLLKLSCDNIFIPVTLQGGFRNLEDIKIALRNGADKVSINTGAVVDKKLISKASKKFGNQAIVVSVDVKKMSNTKWEVLVEKGRERTGIDIIDWIKFIQKSGAGEVHLNSIDMDGTENGLDIDLIKCVNKICKIPLIIGGGLGNLNHLKKIYKIKFIDGLSVSSALHYKRLKIKQIKKTLIKNFSIRI